MVNGIDVMKEDGQRWQFEPQPDMVVRGGRGEQLGLRPPCFPPANRPVYPPPHQLLPPPQQLGLRPPFHQPAGVSTSSTSSTTCYAQPATHTHMHECMHSYIARYMHTHAVRCFAPPPYGRPAVLPPPPVAGWLRASRCGRTFVASASCGLAWLLQLACLLLYIFCFTAFAWWGVLLSSKTSCV